MSSRIACTVLLALAALAFSTGAASAANPIVVANSNDAGAGSLRQAILDVEDGGTITIPASVGEIALTGGELVVNKSLTIKGAGSGQTSISGQGLSRVLRLSGAPSVMVSGVQILEGRVASTGATETRQGGGVLVEGGSLTLSNSLLVSNTVDTAVGGSSGISEGGGVAATGAATTLILQNTIVSDNRVVAGSSGNAWGGGVMAKGTLLIEGGAVKGNTAQGSSVTGGGIYYPSGPRATLSDLTVSGNIDEPAPGATADVEGGGIDLSAGSGDTITNVTVSGNVAEVDNPAAASVIAEGGGIRLAAAGTTVLNSTIADNLVSAHVMERGLPLGGGIFVGASATIVNSTLVGNTSQGSGALLDSEGGDLWTGAQVQVENTILSEGAVAAGAQNCAVSTPGAIVSAGHNIDSLDQCDFHAGGDQVDTSPALRPLADNGGPVETMALQLGSLAIDAGDDDGCPATDARGVLRPAGETCDIGAFEVATPAAASGSASGVSGEAATLNGTATNPDLADGTVSFQFGKTAAYGTQTAPQPIGPTTSGARFSAIVEGLAPGTTYHFRELVTNAVGTKFGADRVFTTSPTQTPTPPARCIVPKLRGKNLRIAKKKLTKAGCKLGKVTGQMSKTAKVKKQSPKPGRVLAAGAKVGIKLRK